MKYWVVATEEPVPEHAPMFNRATNLRHYLAEHPEEPGALLYWWYGEDLVEVAFHSREEILAGGATKAKRGATLEWLSARGMV